MTDLRLMRHEPPEGCSASPLNDEDVFVWSATIFGPPDSAWEGGIFSMRLTFTDAYPERPPRCQFVSEVFHPNVYKDGSLCLDIIQDKWRPIYTVNTILMSIQSLLADPNSSSPANPEAARLYDRKAYERRFVPVRKARSKKL
ncbi:Ubiquitin-conjugating enzyme E2 2 [Porphyridium purpureum]|uniref:Ubiquitin-conjugating enzyme E2 2 n=1 Tax=Porphyridium purpureum TaxID=35688 RepID=A0A5J4YI20_PORPP|nr:Ubiquitin-conjugating enzyme E2 2 [Porphyridium purpureum]|eukprot:POR7979..scf257_31